MSKRHIEPYRFNQKVCVRGDLFGVGRKTLLDIGELTSKEIFCVSFHTGKIIQRFIRLSMDSGVDRAEITRVIREACLSPGELLSFLQNYMQYGGK